MLINWIIDETDIFLERHKLLKLTQEEIEGIPWCSSG